MLFGQIWASLISSRLRMILQRQSFQRVNSNIDRNSLKLITRLDYRNQIHRKKNE